MKCLEYPFDSEYVLRKKKSIKRELLSKDSAFIEKNIAILGGSTTNDIKVILELFLLNQGIKPNFYESEYDHYYEDALYSNETLDKFEPDIIYVHTTFRNISRLPQMCDRKEEIEQCLEQQTAHFISVWEALQQRFHCPIIQNNFEYPTWRLLGNKDCSDIHGVVNFVTRLNLEFAKYAQEHDDFFICDINYLAASYGLDEWADSHYWYMYKYALNVSAIPLLAHNVANIIKSIFGKNKKVMVLDLDNTLWGGVVGDDGVEQLEIGPETPLGQNYLEFQQYVKAHKDMGIILAIASKNDHDNAIAGINHPSGKIKEDDFAIIKANWQPKDKNVSEIAKELNVMPDSLVFVDDNPAERAIVTEQVSGVDAPEIGTIERYISVLDKSGFFEVTYFSDDDVKRNDMYQANAKRTQSLVAYSSYEDYLKALEMKAVIEEFKSLFVSRISQLTNKSNQFNLTTHRYTQTEITDIMNNSQYITLYAKLEDKFGDNGVVSVVIAKINGTRCEIETWLMSCRVLQRGLEEAMMDKLVQVCKTRKIESIHGTYLKTAKNSMVADFYAKMGFDNVSVTENGDSKWIYIIPDTYLCKNNNIDVRD